MDLPLELKSNSVWIYGIEELKQNIISLLKDPIGSFLQDINVGAQFSVHTASDEDLEEGVRATLEQIPYIKVDSIDVTTSDDETVTTISIQFEYNKEVINFQYNIEL